MEGTLFTIGVIIRIRVEEIVSFSTKFGKEAFFGAAKVSHQQKFSPWKSYFSPIPESFLPRKWSRYMVCATDCPPRMQRDHGSWRSSLQKDWRRLQRENLKSKIVNHHTPHTVRIYTLYLTRVCHRYNLIQSCSQITGPGCQCSGNETTTDAAHCVCKEEWWWCQREVI